MKTGIFEYKIQNMAKLPPVRQFAASESMQRILVRSLAAEFPTAEGVLGMKNAKRIISLIVMFGMLLSVFAPYSTAAVNSGISAKPSGTVSSEGSGTALSMIIDIPINT